MTTIEPAPPLPIRVRGAAPGDLAAIVEFNRRLAEETEGRRLDLGVLERGVAHALAHPGRLRYWVAEHAVDGAVLAQAAVTLEWSDWRNGWVWWLQSVYVAAEHRGQGLFRALYQYIRNLATAEADVVGVRLYVEESNHRAQRTYRSLGLKPGGYLVYEDLWQAKPPTV